METKKKDSKLVRKLAMFFVALLVCLISTASSSWLSSKDVIAVGGVPIITNAVTKQDIENAKKKRDEARAQA